jgi:glycosyltransferase involved in cell wall biosynthesis
MPSTPNSAAARPRIDRVLFLPERRASVARSNSYADHMLEAWRKAGFAVGSTKLRSLRSWLAALAKRRQTVAVTNWLEGELVDASGRRSFKGRFRFYRKLLTLRLVAAKLVYVQHNRHPHHTKAEDVEKVQATLASGLRRFVDVVVTHDFEPPGSRAHHLPHPAYPVKVDPALPPEERVVCFGRIGPYKALDRLVLSWTSDWPLLIAGQVQDAAYLERLRVLAEGRNVQFQCESLSDQEAARLLASSAAAIVAHSPPSMIVSGSLYFALSCGVPVVAVGLQHARRLQAAGQPGVHYLPALEQLGQVDWRALRGADRFKIRDALQRRCSIEAIAALLPGLLEPPRPRLSVA